MGLPMILVSFLTAFAYGQCQERLDTGHFVRIPPEPDPHDEAVPQKKALSRWWGLLPLYRFGGLLSGILQLQLLMQNDVENRFENGVWCPFFRVICAAIGTNIQTGIKNVEMM